MEQLLSSLLGPISRGLRDTNAFGNTGDIYSDTQYRGQPLTMPAPSGGGFAANYTPIRFAPLVSLTGPVMAPATPAAPKAAAPEAAAPLIRPPMMADQSGSYEIPTRTDAAFQNLQPIGTRIEQNGIGPELRDLGSGLSFMTSPLTSTASLLATGKLPLDYVLGSMGGAAPAPGAPTAVAPFGGFLQGLRDFLFGPQQESVSLGDMQAGLSSQGLGMGAAVFSDAMNAALASGASEEAANLAGSTALGLFAQGMDPASAVALGSATQISRNPFDMTSEQPAAPSAPTGMPELSRNPFDLTAPAAPQAAQTFALGQPSESSYSGSDFSGYGGGTAGETGAPGESSYGLDR